MRPFRTPLTVPVAITLLSVYAFGQEPASSDTVRLADFRMRDANVLVNPSDQTYYIVSSARGGGVRAYTSQDLVDWSGPHTPFQTPEEFWPGCDMRGIWAPELHKYQDKYYLFVTFNTATELEEQWPDWRPRVRRGSQILVSDSPLGPFEAFERKPTLPEHLMTLDGTLWVEDGTPYMVYCHEWVQVVNGTMNAIELSADLSTAVGEPQRLFWGNEAPWAKRSETEGCWVTDGPSLYTSMSGKLFMIWSSFSETGYTVGLAISDSGKLAGPWRQQAKPIFSDHGGHGSLFTRFDGQLMLVLHQPNLTPHERARMFEVTDTGESLVIERAFP